jgi:hypothetical protein
MLQKSPWSWPTVKAETYQSINQQIKALCSKLVLSFTYVCVELPSDGSSSCLNIRDDSNDSFAGWCAVEPARILRVIRGPCPPFHDDFQLPPIFKQMTSHFLDHLNGLNLPLLTLQSVRRNTYYIELHLNKHFQAYNMSLCLFFPSLKQNCMFACCFLSTKRYTTNARCC